MEFDSEFSFQTRTKAIERFKNEKFDLLIIGGGITGAAVARDATSRGLNVALVEKNDFAYGTSSRSSKLIHGGIRYLENLEFGLVFEALSERTLLLKTVPHLVRPLPFYMPVYKEDAHGITKLSMGLWLYDFLALFRAPGFHKRLSKKQVLADIPFLKGDGLQGGFSYFDASMWDDVLAIETARAAQIEGAAIANYVEAVDPIWTGDRITGFTVRDRENISQDFPVHADRVIVCAGPWTDQVGKSISTKWKQWLNPSKGVHLIFDLKRIPIPGAMVMSHPKDGRISFVIPRPDFGAGVVIVGTTDGPTHEDPDRADIAKEDVDYLLDLLAKYFPSLNLTQDDILSAYVGVRPLMGSNDASGAGLLQKVSREHHIDSGPGGTVIVAGGKYTTHRKMAEEIVDFTLKKWKKDVEKHPDLSYPKKLGPSQTAFPVNPQATVSALENCRGLANQEKLTIPTELLERFGADALPIVKSHTAHTGSASYPDGFPMLEAQLRYCIRSEMTMHLEDFYLRRLPLFASRKDHGLPWAPALAQVWAEELHKSPEEEKAELEKLKQEIAKRTAWEQS